MIGKSKISNKKYYAQYERIEMSSSSDVVILPDRPQVMAYQTDRTICSGPALFTARHCFSRFYESVMGKKYVMHNGLEGKVVYDYSPPLYNIIARILRFFGLWVGVKDVVRVSSYIYDIPVGVVSAGYVNYNYMFFTAVPGIEPSDLLQKTVEARIDYPETYVVKGKVTDYAIIEVYTDNFMWPLELYVVETNRPLRPGSSGAPVYIL